MVHLKEKQFVQNPVISFHGDDTPEKFPHILTYAGLGAHEGSLGSGSRGQALTGSITFHREWRPMAWIVSHLTQAPPPLSREVDRSEVLLGDGSPSNLCNGYVNSDAELAPPLFSGDPLLAGSSKEKQERKSESGFVS